MGRKRAGARAKRLRLRSKPASEQATTGFNLKLAYWNCNGISSLSKQQEIVDALNSKELDLVFIDETHLRKGTNVDMSVFAPWSPIFTERDFNMKTGGGKLILKSDRVNCSEWTTTGTDNDWINSERSWLLVHSGGCKLAICSVYMAAEVTANNDFVAWNDCLYSSIQGELKGFQQTGYKCMIIGDMNAHVGDMPEGIVGNRPGVNSNGRKLLNFVQNNGLVMLNKEKNICSGTFTRITPVSSSILDYVLVTPDLTKEVVKMVVDEDLALFTGSDHVAITVDLLLDCKQEPSPDRANKGLFLRPDRDLSRAKAIMDVSLNECNWDSLTLDDKCEKLQEILVMANTEAYGGEKPKKVRKVIRIKKLRARRQVAERNRNRLSLVRAKKKLRNQVWSEAEQEQLMAAAVECSDLSEEIRKKELEIKLDKRRTFRSRKSNIDNQFWNLARRVEKKKGLLAAINDCDGKLVTEFLQLKDTVVTEMAKVSMGQTSKVFTSRGQQLLKEVTIKNDCAFEKWCPKERDEFEYQDEVCQPVGVADVMEIIKSLKVDRAPGIDNVTPSMLKGASTSFIGKLTEVVNESLKEGKVPASLLVGKMTLIDKKEPSLDVAKKRPITVSSVMLSMVTKIVQKRMDTICEREGFYGPVQYGFRSRKSTVDCVFMILAALRNAKRNHQSISLAFCDIAKAYDSVCRELLYTKLRSIGFGGRVVSLIRSMYFNDCVQINLAHGLSEPLFFTQGVKQGCSLSPLLFALYIASLGQALDNSKLGVKLGKVMITAIFFADDLLLLSRTPNRGMNKLLRIVSGFCMDMHMKLATSKTYILTNSPNEISWKVDNVTIEEILVAKYLGVTIQVRGRSMIGVYEKDMIRKATNYAYAIMNLSRGVLDRAMVAKRLWESCAIPAILYCVEAVTLKKATVVELERLQGMVGRFILQIPSSSSKVLTWMDAGLMPMAHRIQTRQALFIWSILKSKSNTLLMEVLRELLEHPTDPWVKSWVEIQRDVGTIATFVSKKELQKAMSDRAVSFVVTTKRAHSSVVAASQPWKWFRLQGFVNDSRASKTLCRIRAGNAELGNRYKDRYGCTHVYCPWCLSKGVRARLVESHVVLVCPCVAAQRRDFGIAEFHSNSVVRGKKPIWQILRAYLGGDGSDQVVLLERGRKMAVLLESWLAASHVGQL